MFFPDDYDPHPCHRHGGLLDCGNNGHGNCNNSSCDNGDDIGGLFASADDRACSHDCEAGILIDHSIRLDSRTVSRPER